MYYNDYNHQNWLDVPQQPVSQPENVPGAPEKKKRVWPKVAALCLSCAILGAAAGGGVAAMIGSRNAAGTAANGDVAPSGPSTTLYTGEHEGAEVNTTSIHSGQILTGAQIYAAYVNSTVGITTEVDGGVNIFGQRVQNAASGSGFIISKDGYIVTNYHVIEDANSIKVTLYDGKSFDAKLIGGEEENDIAVLKIDAQNLTPVVLGDSDKLVVGAQVAAIGNPLGELTFSMTQGTVSALNRNVTMSDGTRMNYIQTDTAINSGNSGGPLFNMYGEVIGVVSAKLSGSSGSSASIEGLGFAIPLNDVRGMIEDIIQYGYVTGQPYMGVVVSSVSGEAQRYGTPAGAYILGVVEGSCAEKAGLETGDIVTKIGEAEVTSADDLMNANKDYEAGDTVTLSIVRSGEKRTVSITFDEETSKWQEASNELYQEIQEEQQRQQQEQYQNSYGNGFGWGWPFGW